MDSKTFWAALTAMATAVVAVITILKYLKVQKKGQDSNNSNLSLDDKPEIQQKISKELSEPLSTYSSVKKALPIYSGSKEISKPPLKASIFNDILSGHPKPENQDLNVQLVFDHSSFSSCFSSFLFLLLGTDFSDTDIIEIHLNRSRSGEIDIKKQLIFDLTAKEGEHILLLKIHKRTQFGKWTISSISSEKTVISKLYLNKSCVINMSVSKYRSKLKLKFNPSSSGYVPFLFRNFWQWLKEI